jgi:hypothetical protein
VKIALPRFIDFMGSILNNHKLCARLWHATSGVYYFMP